MSNKNIEMMKKIIEEKKKKSAEQCSNARPEGSIGELRKAHRNTKKTGGAFDK